MDSLKQCLINTSCHAIVLLHQYYELIFNFNNDIKEYNEISLVFILPTEMLVSWPDYWAIGWDSRYWCSKRPLYHKQIYKNAKKNQPIVTPTDCMTKQAIYFPRSILMEHDVLIHWGSECTLYNCTLETHFKVITSPSVKSCSPKWFTRIGQKKIP